MRSPHILRSSRWCRWRWATGPTKPGLSELMRKEGQSRQLWGIGLPLDVIWICQWAIWLQTNFILFITMNNVSRLSRNCYATFWTCQNMQIIISTGTNLCSRHTLWGVRSVMMFCKAFLSCSTGRRADTAALVQPYRQSLSRPNSDFDSSDAADFLKVFQQLASKLNE